MPFLVLYYYAFIVFWQSYDLPLGYELTVIERQPEGLKRKGNTG